MFGGEHKQTDIAQSAIFTTGSMRASRFYPAILFSFLIMYGDYSFDLSSKIRIISSHIFSPFTQIEYLAKDSFNSFDSYFSSQKKLQLSFVHFFTSYILASVMLHLTFLLFLVI